MNYLDPKFIIETLGLVGIFALVFAESGLFFGFFLPGDTLLFTAGLVASQNILSLSPLVVGSIIFAIFGDSVGYAFGKKIGPKLFTREHSFFWNKDHIEKSHKFFEKYGKKAIILARFMPIVRTFTPILAGVGTMEYKTFLRYNIVGGILWVSGLTLCGYFFGKIIPDPDKYLLPIILLITIVSLLPALKEFINRKK
ncbi:MAG: VTT domain-containing protein [Patescibacteria group bacterium]